MSKLLALTAVLASTVLAAPHAREEQIAFRPAEGMRLVVTLESEVELELVEMTVVDQEGEEHEMDGADIGLTISHGEKLVFTDEILGVADGRVTKLRRTFDEITQTVEQSVETPDGSESNDQTGTSELEGKTVAFTWDAEEESHTVAFEGEEGDEDLLEGLECEADLTGFLPDDPVSEGDTWTVDVDAFDKLLSPSGDLHVLMENETEDEEEMSDQFDDNLEGDITCTLSELREEEGARIAVIAITAKLETRGDEEESLEHEEVGTVDISRETSVHFELEGELLWNLSAGLASEIRLTGDVRFEMLEEQVVESLSASMKREQLLEGTLTHTVRTESPP